MSEYPIEFTTCSFPEDGFQLDVPQGWEVNRSQPVAGASYYFIPVGDKAGGFSVYRTLGEGDNADSRLDLEREMTESLEVISRTEVQIAGRSAERLVYVAEEVSPWQTITDERGRRQDIGPERQLMYSDFVFLTEKGAGYVLGYKINASVRDRYVATLEHMLDSFAFS